MLWDTISYVYSSKIRYKILQLLASKVQTPKQLADDLSYAMSHISRALKELELKETITCLTPERNKGKMYQITSKGKEILIKIEEMSKT